jgi:hypothetical protein
MPALYSPTFGAAATTANSLLEVSYPGSMAPHFRVQVLAGDCQPEWKMVASFSDQKLAQICLDRLRKQGEFARLIAYRRVPTAA